MRIASGKVIGGVVIIEGTPLPEGATVTVLTRQHEEAFDLAPAEEEALLQAIREADRGELIEASELLRDIRTLD